MNENRADTRLVPLNGSSLLGGVTRQVRHARPAQQPGTTPPPLPPGSDRRWVGIQVDEPKACLHVGGDAIVDGAATVGCIRFGKPAAPGETLNPQPSLYAQVARLAARVAALEARLQTPTSARF